MTSNWRHAAWVTLLFGAGGWFALYGLTIGTANDAEARQSAGLLAGLGFALLVAAALVAMATFSRRQSLRFLPTWAPAIALVPALVVGAIAARSERWPALDPIIAVVAICATFLIFAGVITHGAPRHTVGKRVTLGTTIWGMTVAPLVAVVFELAAVMVLVGGGLIGLYYRDPSFVRALGDRFRDGLNEQSLGDYLTTPTMIIGVFALYAVMAPLAEEFAKLLGAVVFIPRSAPTTFDAFLAGAFSGLGFASVETLFYALAAGEQWPLIALLRAPVAVIHVVAAAAAAMGWFAGGRGVVVGFASAVLLHGAWNGLTIGVLVLSTTAADPDSISPVAALGVLMALGAMGVLIVASSVWLVREARRLGRAAAALFQGNEPPPTTSTTHSSPEAGVSTHLLRRSWVD